MNRSSSEWAFQRFLEEIDSHPPPPISSSNSSSSSSSASSCCQVSSKSLDEQVVEVIPSPALLPAPPRPAPPPGIGSTIEEQQAILKRNLDLACAAVALARQQASAIKPPDFAPVADNGPQVSDVIQSGLQSPGKGSGCSFSNEPNKAAATSLGIPALPAMQKRPGVQIRPATSASSREQSDDDDLEGEIEITDNMDPADVKRVRRKLSNRESARRSRRRKQAHMNELEAQVAQLKDEKSSLLKRFSDISQKYNEAAVDNRVLKADLETLRAKVKMAEETVKRVAAMNPMFRGMCEIPNMGMPFDGSSSDTSGDAAVPVRENQKQYFYHEASKNPPNNSVPVNALADAPPVPSPEEVRNPNGGNKMGRTPSMHRVASLEHLQKRIRGATAASSPVNWDALPMWDDETQHALEGSNRQGQV